MILALIPILIRTPVVKIRARVPIVIRTIVASQTITTVVITTQALLKATAMI
jgi:hypothetical protein